MLNVHCAIHFLSLYLDILLTQNMNKLDSLVASTQTAVKNAYGESATSCNDRSHDISSNAANVVTCEVETKCITSGERTGSSLGKRLIGHGGMTDQSCFMHACLD